MAPLWVPRISRCGYVGKLAKCVKTLNGRGGVSSSPVRTHPRRLPSARHRDPGGSTAGRRDAHNPAAVAVAKGGDGAPGAAPGCHRPARRRRGGWGAAWPGEGDTRHACPALRSLGGRLCRDTERRHAEGAAASRLLGGPRGGAEPLSSRPPALNPPRGGRAPALGGTQTHFFLVFLSSFPPRPLHFPPPFFFFFFLPPAPPLPHCRHY